MLEGITMPRRTFADDLVLLPWWALLCLAAFVYFGLKALATIKFSNIYLTPIAQSLSYLAVPFALVLVFLAGMSVLRSFSRRRLLDKQRDIESIRALEWDQFERLVAEAYTRKGFSVTENISAGADDGIDLVMKKNGSTTLVQCKNWRSTKVGAPVVREFLGAMTAKKADHGIVICSGEFTKPAQTFAQENKIELVPGNELALLVSNVQENQSQDAPQDSAVTCPSCGGDMVKRTARRGKNAGNMFWGCERYPDCKGIRNLA